MMFDRQWLENELNGLIAQLHRTEGAISVLQAMIEQLDRADNEPPGMPLDEFQATLPEGYTVEGIVKNED